VGCLRCDLSDERGFSEAYELHRPRVVAAARGVLGDEQRAEETAQEVFLRLWRNPRAFDPARGDLGAFLSLMARSRAVDVWRSEHARERAVERLAERARGDERIVDGPPTDAERAEQAEALRVALRLLPAPQREALFLRHWGGLTMKEIARATGTSLATVKGRLRLGLAKLAAAGPPEDLGEAA
jgi:RNA polymerase sigma-70 factor (ECF subfamily)